jgi:hypothetical protein
VELWQALMNMIMKLKVAKFVVFMAVKIKVEVL